MSSTRSSIRYDVSFPDAAAHLIDVTLGIPVPDPAGQRLTLANWIPGSYMIRDFSRNVVRIRASAGGEDVPLDKLDKSTWRAPPVSGPLVVEMQVYAWELSVRAAHVDRTHAFFNGTSVFLCPEGQADAPVEVVVERPLHDGAERWRVATAMDPVDVDDAGFGRYAAANHDELIDHPFELGTFERLAFDVAGRAARDRADRCRAVRRGTARPGPSARLRAPRALLRRARADEALSLPDDAGGVGLRRPRAPRLDRAARHARAPARARARADGRRRP